MHAYMNHRISAHMPFAQPNTNAVGDTFGEREDQIGGATEIADWPCTAPGPCGIHSSHSFISEVTPTPLPTPPTPAKYVL
jgi:hypothetical protein